MHNQPMFSPAKSDAVIYNKRQPPWNAFPQKGLSYEKSGKTTFLQTQFSAADKSCGTSGSAVHTMQPAIHPVLPYRPLSQ